MGRRFKVILMFLVVFLFSKLIAVYGILEPELRRKSKSDYGKWLKSEYRDDAARREALTNEESEFRSWISETDLRLLLRTHFGIDVDGGQDPWLQMDTVLARLHKRDSLAPNSHLRGQVNAEDYVAAGFDVEYGGVVSLDVGQNKTVAGGHFEKSDDGALCFHPMRLTQHHFAQINGTNKRQRDGIRATISDSERNAGKREQQRVETEERHWVPNQAEALACSKPRSMKELRAEANLRFQRDQWSLSACLKVVEWIRGKVGDPRKSITVLWGGDCNKYGLGAARGARVANSNLLLRVLSEYFLVVILTEEFTSQLCPKCFSQLHYATKRSYRRKECRNPTCQVQDKDDKPVNFRCDRDIAAAVNFVHILRYMIAHEGKRPHVFTHEWQNKNPARTRR